MHKGSKFNSPFPPIYSPYHKFGGKGVFDENGLIDVNSFDELSKKINQFKDKFLLVGVIEIKGKKGYRILNDFKDAKKVIEKLKEVVSNVLLLDNKKINFVSALHQNTIDKHIHFLFFGDDKKVELSPNEYYSNLYKERMEKKMIIYLNSNEFQTYLDEAHKVGEFNKYNQELFDENNHLFEYEMGVIELARNLVYENNDLPDFENLPFSLKMEVSSLSNHLLMSSSSIRRRYFIVKDLVSELILKDPYNEMLDKIYDFVNVGFFDDANRLTIYLLNSTKDYLKESRYSNLKRTIKKESSKFIIKDVIASTTSYLKYLAPRTLSQNKFCLNDLIAYRGEQKAKDEVSTSMELK